MDQPVRALADMVNGATRLGARAAELVLDCSAGHEIVVRRGRVLRQNALTEVTVTARCWLDGGKMGTAEVSSVDEVPMALERALVAAGDAEPDPRSGPVSDVHPTVRGLGIDDLRYGAIDNASRADVVLSAERAARSADRAVTTGEFRYADRRCRRVYLNTKGVTLEEYGTTYLAEGTVIGSDDRSDLRLDERVEGRSFASSASLPFGTSLAKRLSKVMRDGPTLSGKVRVMMPPRVSAALFSKIGEVFGWPDPSESFLGRGAEGERIIHRKLHLVDDGSMPGALRTRAFDDRGCTPLPLTLLREGVFDQTFRTLEFGRSADVPATGHMWGSRLSPNNLALRQGTRSMSALMSEHDQPTLLADHFEDLDALDLRTGHFRTRVSGVMRRGSTDDGGVRRVTIEGNMLEILRGLVDIASDTDRIGHVDAPGMLVDGFVVI